MFNPTREQSYDMFLPCAMGNSLLRKRKTLTQAMLQNSKPYLSSVLGWSPSDVCSQEWIIVTCASMPVGTLRYT